VVADNGLIHDEILSLFEEIFSGQYRVPMPAILGWSAYILSARLPENSGYSFTFSALRW